MMIKQPRRVQLTSKDLPVLPIYLFHSPLNDILLVEYWKERDQRTLQHESKSPTVTQVGADYTEWYTALQCGGNGWFPGLA